MISATAPGKAVLSGEYAVLGDAPAISAAVDCRARVSISESEDELHCLEAPGYASGRWHFRVTASGVIDWQDSLADPAMFSLVEAVFGSIGTAQWRPLTLVVNTEAFYDRQTGNKFGFGSSAAVAVSLAAALRAFALLDADQGRTAMAAHDRFQNGRGSGVDVATSQQGGLILYRRGTTDIRRIGWPAGLQYRFLWSGRSAATADKLERLSKRRGQAGDSMQRLSERSQEIAGAWSSGDVKQILASYPAYIETLSEVSDDHDLGIFDAGHRALARLATERGIVYKPCGAGGGDIGIVLAECEHDIDKFLKDSPAAGFTMLEVALDETGLKLAE